MNAKAALVLGVLATSTIGCGNSTAPKPEKLNPELAAKVLSQVPSDLKHPTAIDFEGKVELVGYELAPEGDLKPGAKFSAKFYWLSKERLTPGWLLFTHLMGPHDQQLQNFTDVGPLRKQVTGADGIKRQALPPSAWEPGKVYVDEQELQIPADIRVPTVTLTVGVWKRVRLPSRDKAKPGALTSARLVVLGGRSAPGNRAIIAHINTGWRPPKQAANKKR